MHISQSQQPRRVLSKDEMTLAKYNIRDEARQGRVDHKIPREKKSKQTDKNCAEIFAFATSRLKLESRNHKSKTFNPTLRDKTHKSCMES